MAKCKDCKLDMAANSTVSCTYPYIKLNGKWYKRNTSYYDYNKRCHDCNIVNHGGHVHHYGCDIERCPRCKGQLLSCECTGRQTAKSMPMGSNSTGFGFDVHKETGVWN